MREGRQTYGFPPFFFSIVVTLETKAKRRELFRMKKKILFDFFAHRFGKHQFAQFRGTQ